MASIAMPVLSAAVSARVSVRAKVSTRGLRAVGVKPLPVRPAAVRVSASAAAESQTDDLQLGQVRNKPAKPPRYPIRSAGFDARATSSSAMYRAKRVVDVLYDLIESNRTRTRVARGPRTRARDDRSRLPRSKLAGK
jgi:hypothetical protein|tara:strand:+ start:176 stop:586 length:411 start_codon:yes stop_codon:yes gene_type:complete